MANGKKYYWIKLKENFITSDKVDFLMSQKNGANYIVLYIMMCIKCMNTGGVMARQLGEMIIPYDVDKITRDFKYFSREVVIIALTLYKKLGMIYEEEDGFLRIADFNDMVGSETDYAQKKREYREAKKQVASQSVNASLIDNVSHKTRDNVLDNVSDNVSDNVRQENRDKIIENRDQIIDKDKENISRISNDILCQTQSVRRCVEAWNTLSEYGIRKVSKLDSNSKRYKSLVARIEHYGESAVLEAIENIKQSDFLQGKHDGRDWQITFDWFVLPNNFPKVLDGNYSNSKSNKGGVANGNKPNERSGGSTEPSETEDDFTRLCKEFGL